ncbi:iron-containing alcohol dehydrogenase [Siculibacillus lacustris]|uniref:Alcohol dehydrogenase 2 n=1 Tax=Siculibacillus lacustris TaxID=1549641 RepID=A0A4Q9VXZ4_9HYPH|nr:iron-containing alcohol dehydrogenase [Siculibacillus lacustris]TBW41386.1 iron-containing alcohol dehydrogenase [Siculibacillus lacustris]
MTFRLCFPKINLSGAGALADVPAELVAHGCVKPLIVTDSTLTRLGVVQPLVDGLKAAGLTPAIYDGVVPNPTVIQVEAAFAIFQAEGCDSIVAVGGGSPIDTGKAVRILSANPGPITLYNGVGKVGKVGAFLIAVNTTAGTAAEVTSNAVITDPAAQVKMVIIDANIIPDVSVNDASMMLGIPAATTAATGMDALTHAIEAYVSLGHHVLTDFSALEAIRLIAAFLPRAVADGHDLEAREMMAYGQFIAGLAFNSAGLGYVHAMAHQPGAVKDLPHGVCNAILLPIVEAFNRPHAVARFARIAQAMGVDTAGLSEEAASLAAIAAIRDLSAKVGIPHGFGELGVTEADLPTFVAKAQKDPCAPGNPVPMNDDQVLALFREAM